MTTKLYGPVSAEPIATYQQPIWNRIWQRVRSPPVVLLVVMAFLIIASVYPTKYLQQILGFVEQLGAVWGTVVLVLLFVSTALLFLPGVGATLAIFSGYWGGLYLGTCLSWFGGAVGALLCFYLGRAVLYARVARWSDSYPLFTAIANSVTRGGGWKLIVLLRVSPLTPFTLISYLLSATNISTKVYIVSTIAGMLPPTAFFCYIGTAARSVTDVLYRPPDAEDPTRAWIMYISLSVTIVAAVVVTILTSRAIQHELKHLKRQGEMALSSQQDGRLGDIEMGRVPGVGTVMRNTPFISASAVLPPPLLYATHSSSSYTLSADGSVQLV